jgi:hypothetical protein
MWNEQVQGSRDFRFRSDRNIAEPDNARIFGSDAAGRESGKLKGLGATI